MISMEKEGERHCSSDEMFIVFSLEVAKLSSIKAEK